MRAGGGSTAGYHDSTRPDHPPIPGESNVHFPSYRRRCSVFHFQKLLFLGGRGCLGLTTATPGYIPVINSSDSSDITAAAIFYLRSDFPLSSAAGFPSSDKREEIWATLSLTDIIVLPISRILTSRSICRSSRTTVGIGSPLRAVSTGLAASFNSPIQPVEGRPS